MRPATLLFAALELLFLWCGLVSATAAGSPELSVAQFVAQHPANGEYTLLAYIDEVYLCPPCPKGAQCKPCMGHNITISDGPARAATPAGEKLTVFITPSDGVRLQTGRRYRLRVALAGSLRLRGAEQMP
jgi:hypothetical protein